MRNVPSEASCYSSSVLSYNNDVTLTYSDRTSDRMYQGVVNDPDTGVDGGDDHHEEPVQDYEAISAGTVKECFKDHFL